MFPVCVAPLRKSSQHFWENGRNVPDAIAASRARTVGYEALIGVAVESTLQGTVVSSGVVSATLVRQFQPPVQGPDGPTCSLVIRPPQRTAPPRPTAANLLLLLLNLANYGPLLRGEGSVPSKRK